MERELISIGTPATVSCSASAEAALNDQSSPIAVRQLSNHQIAEPDIHTGGTTGLG